MSSLLSTQLSLLRPNVRLLEPRILCPLYQHDFPIYEVSTNNLILRLLTPSIQISKFLEAWILCCDSTHSSFRETRFSVPPFFRVIEHVFTL
jgi:hypothetical protein